MRISMLVLYLASIILGSASGISANLPQSTSVLATAKEEILEAAAAHRVSVQVDRTAFAGDSGTTIVNVPIKGIEKYRDRDFAAGAPIQLLVITSRARFSIPNGSYVVKVKFSPGATAGQVMFTNSKGAVVARKELIIRTRDQAAILFPGVYPETSNGGPQEIPNITSTHIWVNTPNGPRLAVDCAGWQPYKVLIFLV